MQEPGLLPSLKDRRVLLAISGGVAAYKAAELCRLLVRCGAEVRVMMTEAGRRFVGEATLAALSGYPVATDLFDPVQEAQIGHIGLADWGEVLLVAPATADLLAKLAQGLAGDVVTTVHLAFGGPVLLAPAMNVRMWNHPATQHNVAQLRQRAYRLVGPEAGDLACGHVGAGRMAEPEQLLEAVWGCLATQDLAGRRVLVSAGPTREAVDPVRFLSNPSSGKMGFSLAAEAAARGARVTLVAGPIGLTTPLGVDRRDVISAAEMAEVVCEEGAAHDVVIMAAAVADYRPETMASQKLKKAALGDTPSLPLVRTEDILARLGAARAGQGGPLLVGFAAETQLDSEEINRKLTAKRCDLLVVNDVAAAGSGFAVDTNRVTVVARDGDQEPLPLLGKREIAGAVLARVARLLDASKAQGTRR